VGLFSIAMILMFLEAFDYYYVTRARLLRSVGIQVLFSRTSAAVMRFIFSVLLFSVAYGAKDV